MRVTRATIFSICLIVSSTGSTNIYPTTWIIRNPFAVVES